MVFSSLIFIFMFLPVSLLVYYISPYKYRNLILFVISLIFYAWGEPVYITIMLFSTVFDFINGIQIEKMKQKNEQSKAKAILIISIVVNLGILCFFKYTNFFIGNINTMFSINIGFINLALPIGISFYTFQTMSYTIDVYRGEVKAQKNIITFGAFVALFPQFVAGPIVRYKTIEEQLNNRHESFEKFSEGVKRFVIGLGKKVLLANNIGVIWEEISSSNIRDLPVLTAWLGAIAFTFQIYFDFSGYSDMAIGLGKMFGFDFLENFNHPYMAKNVTDFWRRWHISLSSWFKDYVYIPLGGNRGSKAMQIRNLIVVWALTGFWHGASWNFVIWGLYFSVVLILEKMFLYKLLEKLPSFVCHIYTMLIVIISWVIFAFEDFSNMKTYIKSMFGLNHNVFINNYFLYLLTSSVILLIILTVCSTNIAEKLKVLITSRISSNSAKIIVIKNICYVVIILVSVAFLVGDSYNPFLYFRF